MAYPADAIVAIAASTPPARDYLIGPQLWLAALMVILTLVVVRWGYRRRAEIWRGRMEAVNGLAEHLIHVPPTAGDPVVTALPRMARVLHDTFGYDEVRVYRYDGGAQTLTRVVEEGDLQEPPMVTDLPDGELAPAPVLALRNRSSLRIRDARRCPIPIGPPADTNQQSALCLPMMAGGELSGILVVSKRQPSDYTVDEESMLSHLANEMAIVTRVREQSAMREQLLRTERIAAAQQLIRETAEEVTAPLNSVLRIARDLLQSPEPNLALAALEEEATRAHLAVEQLRGASEQAAPQEAGVTQAKGLLETVLALYQARLARQGIQLETAISAAHLETTGSLEPLQRVLLSLLDHAEDAAKREPEHPIRVTTAMDGTDRLLRIQFYRPPVRPEIDPLLSAEVGDDDGRLTLPQCEEQIRDAGGELRVLKVGQERAQGQALEQTSFEIILPGSAMNTMALLASTRPVRRLTLLAVAPDDRVREQLAQVLAVRGHRVITAVTMAEAVEQAIAFRFDAACAPVHLDAHTWIDLWDGVRDRITIFGLVAERSDDELLDAVQHRGVSILRWPATGERALEDITALENKVEGVLQQRAQSRSGRWLISGSFRTQDNSK